MAKILIVYGSTTGNTQSVAEHIQSVLTESGSNVSVFSGAEISPDKIKDYDITFLGSSTWGDGDLQDDMVEFVENIKTVDLKGSKVAVFACGMESFPKFCHAGDIIEEAVKLSGAQIVGGKVFKINGDVGDALEEVGEWAGKIVESL